MKGYSNLCSFDNRVALVTGAAGNIGHAVCLRLAAHGVRIAACDLRAEAVADRMSPLVAEGLHTCLDTSLYAPPIAIEKLLPVTDMWLPDFKCDDDAVHQKFAGVSNEIIKTNLIRLVAAKARLEVRCLVVPGCTEDMPARYAYLDSIGIAQKNVVELEYFEYARSKYKALGIHDTMPSRL